MMIFKWEFRKKVHKITPKIMRLFIEYLLNICGIFAKFQVELLTFC